MRPNRFDKEITKKIAAEILKKVIKWDEAFEDCDTVDSEIIHDLESAIAYDDDAYKICSNLERKGWAPDEELVSIVQAVHYKRLAEHQKVVKEWVRDNEIKPNFNVGDVVTWKRFDEIKTGMISSIDIEDGQYRIKPEKGQSVYIVPYEEVSLA